MKSLLLSFTLFFITYFLHAQQPGTLDPSFGDKGTYVEAPVAEVVGGVIKVTKEGRILVGTSGAYKGFDFTFKIDAYLPNGLPDLSFGENGSAYVLFPDMKKPGDDASIGSLALLPDGRILAGGTQYSINSYGIVAFARFNPNGMIDSTFGTNGTATADFGYDGQGAGSILLQTDGKIVTAGGVATDAEQFIGKLSTARYLSNGSIDESYGNNGIMVSNTIGAANAVALQVDGKIVAAGNNGNIRTDLSNFHLERFNPDGSYDKSFGANGVVDTKIGTGGSFITDVTIQDDGKIVVGGNSNGPIGFVFTVARYNTDGSLDNSFGKGGIVATVFAQDQGICDKVFICGEKRDKIVATGKNYSIFTGVGDFAVVGYNSDGSLDPEFGSGGITLTNLDAKDRTYSADLQTDGKIVQFGFTSSAEVFQLHRAFARYYGYPVHVSLAVRIKRFVHNHGITWNGLPANDNIAYYSIEQSSNSRSSFLPIAKLSGRSNLPDYSFTNSQLLQGSNYYRIKAVSTDGTIRYSEVVSADNIANSASIFPNPASNSITVKGLPTNETANISIKDGSGTILSKGVSSGGTQYRSSLTNLQPGTYYVNITTAGKTETLKFVKE